MIFLYRHCINAKKEGMNMNKKTEENGKKLKKKKFKILTIVFFILFEFVFSAVTAPLIIFYGPFDNVKKTVVGTAMATFTHRYIARIFLTDAEINKILGNTSTSEKQDLNKVQAQHINDSKIVLHNIQTSKFDGYVMEISDPTRVKVAMTRKLGKEGQKTSVIAKEHNAVAAINGGGFSDQSPDGKLWAGTGAYPTGLVMHDGSVLYGDTKSEDEVMDVPVAGITDKGLLMVGNYSINQLKKAGVKEALTFAPVLIVNGNKQINSRNDSQGLNPRTAIAQKKDGTILFLVIDGRQGFKLGASLLEVQNLLYNFGAVNAIELDGGSSTTMYYNGDVINNPCDPLYERTVATAFYVTP